MITLLLMLCSPIVCVLSSTWRGAPSLELPGAIIFFASLAVAFFVTARGLRGRAAGIATVISSVPIAVLYTGSVLLRLMSEH